MKNILKEKIFLYKQSQQKMESLFKRIITLDYIDFWSLVKKIFEGKLLIKEARKQQNARAKQIKDLNYRINPIGPGKRMF